MREAAEFAAALALLALAASPIWAGAWDWMRRGRELRRELEEDETMSEEAMTKAEAAYTLARLRGLTRRETEAAQMACQQLLRLHWCKRRHKIAARAAAKAAEAAEAPREGGRDGE